jgi:hypothetical protein
LVGKIEAVAAIRYEDAELAARSPRISSRERLALDLSNQEFPHTRTDYFLSQPRHYFYQQGNKF